MYQRKWASVADARIRSGTILIVIGCVLITLAALAFIASADSGGGAAVFGEICATCGAGTTAFGMLTQLFRKIELRLIDIQRLTLAISDLPTKSAPGKQET